MPRLHFVPVDTPDPEAIIARPLSEGGAGVVVTTVPHANDTEDIDPTTTANEATTPKDSDTKGHSNRHAALKSCRENLAEARAKIDPNETMAARLADELPPPPESETNRDQRPKKQTTTRWASVDRRDPSEHPSKLVTLRPRVHNAGKRRWRPKDDEDT